MTYTVVDFFWDWPVVRQAVLRDRAGKALFDFCLGAVVLGIGFVLFFSSHDILEWIGRGVETLVRRIWKFCFARATARVARPDKSMRRVLETMKEGSDLQTIPRPACQLALYDYDSIERQKYYLGGAIHVEGGWLVSCTHIVNQLRNKPYASVLDPQGVEQFYSLEGLEWEEIGADVSVAKLGRVFQHLKTAKVGPVEGSVYVRVHSAKGRNNTSVGRLTLDSVTFGLLVYDGSTVAGFSGGAYYLANRVVGIHCGGGAINYGYSMEWIMSVLARRGSVPEAGGQYALRNILRSARKSDVQVTSSGNPDEVQVRVGGKFWIVDREDYVDLMEDDKFGWMFDDDSEREERNMRKRFRDTFYENDREAQGELFPEGSVVSTLNGSATPSGTQELQGLIQSQIQNTIEIQSLKSQQQVMNGLEQKLETLDDLLRSIPITGHAPLMDMLESLERKVTSLSQSLSRQTSSPLREDLSQVRTVGNSTSLPCSEPSTSRVQPVSVNSKRTTPSVRPWDGMESDLRTYVTWRSSVDASRKDFYALRTEFLVQHMPHLTIEQRAELVRLEKARRVNRKKTQKKSSEGKQRKEQNRAIQQTLSSL